MAKKKIIGEIKLQIKGGEATAAPPVGPALGQKGVNIGLFVKEFNNATKDKTGILLPTVITVYSDRSFSFITKVPPVSVLLKNLIELEKGSSTPGKDIVKTIDEKVIEEVAKEKMADLNCYDLNAAKNMVSGSARSMGIKVVKS